jgi:hypothetical protein
METSEGNEAPSVKVWNGPSSSKVESFTALNFAEKLAGAGMVVKFEDFWEMLPSHEMEGRKEKEKLTHLKTVLHHLRRKLWLESLYAEPDYLRCVANMFLRTHRTSDLELLVNVVSCVVMCVFLHFIASE